MSHHPRPWLAPGLAVSMLRTWIAFARFDRAAAASTGSERRHRQIWIA